MLIKEPNLGYDLSPTFTGVHLGCRQNCRQFRKRADIKRTTVKKPWPLSYVAFSDPVAPASHISAPIILVTYWLVCTLSSKGSAPGPVGPLPPIHRVADKSLLGNPHRPGRVGL